MGTIEFMAVGSGIPDMHLPGGSASVLLALMLAVLAVAAFGILRAAPRHSRVPAWRLLHAEGR